MTELPSSPSDRSPLTDPRSLGTSALFHVALLGLASVVALGVVAPRTPEEPPAMTAELGPVDNRAPKAKGGGSPGEIGGMGEASGLKIAAEGTKRDLATERLVGDVLPSSPLSNPIEVPPSGPATSGIGLLEGPGSGGGGGSGGGSGGGKGDGIGPGTEFFGARESASSFAYVIDCSGSMSHRNALGVAKKELLASLDRLPPDARFSVIFYNMKPVVFPNPRGEPGLMAATAENKARIRARLASIRPDGGTDHVRAFRAAIEIKPEVIFFLTDAERMAEDDADQIRSEIGTTRVQAVEFGEGADIGLLGPLGRLAVATGGAFRHVDIGQYGKSTEGNRAEAGRP